MPKRIMGLDLGSWSVKAVVLESTFRGFEIQHAAEIPVEEKDDQSLEEAQRSAVDALLLEPGLRSDFIVAALPGEDASVRVIELPFTNAKQIDKVISGELEDILPFEMDDAVWDHSIASTTDKGTSIVTAAAKAERVGARLAQLDESNVDPKFLGVDTLQLANLYTHYLSEDLSKPQQPVEPAQDAPTFVTEGPDAPPDCRILVDIGHRRTLVTACTEKGPFFVRVLRHGGHAVTASIQEEYNLSWIDAQDGKHADGAAPSTRHPPTTDAAQRMGDAVARGLRPLVRELRHTVQAIRSDRGVRVSRVDLLGGGAGLKHLASHLADALNVPVLEGSAVSQVLDTHAPKTRALAFSLALALALRGASNEEVSTLDFRKGDFQFSGQLEHLGQRLPALGTWAAVLLLLFFVQIGTRHQLLGQQESAVDEAFCALTKRVVGRALCESTVALAALREPPSDLGSFRIPKRSAFEMASDISEAIPPDLEVRLRDFDIREERASIRGDAKDFDAVEQVVANLKKMECITEAKKGNLRTSVDGKGVEFQLTLRLGCS